MMNVLDAREIVAGYGEMDILHGVSLHVGAAETVSVIGPNGSGKSTLLKAVMGLIPVRSGSIMLQDQDVTNEAPDRLVRKGISYVPQTENIFSDLTIRENLEIGGYIRAAGDLDASLDRVFALFPLLGERGRSRAGVLSGGERQQLAIARALMLEPQLLLLDEPTAALSPKMAHGVFERISGISSSGTAILLVEQNARLSLSLSSRAYVMAMGRNELEGDAASLLDDEEVGRVYLGR
jgi:branched-chain amino acid transport system ATP-binding protein/neutral amino acid transport system ATP-binding protein